MAYTVFVECTKDQQVVGGQFYPTPTHPEKGLLGLGGWSFLEIWITA